MKIRIERITPDPIDLIHKSYRLCYAKGNWDEIKERSIEEQIEFIKPLMAEGHTSPLEHVSITFVVEGLSRAAQNQLVRHRTGKFNIQSQRYVNGKNFDVVIPTLDYIEDYETRAWAETEIEARIHEIFKTYNELVEVGVRNEDARAILPNATTCNLVFTFDLNNFRKFLALRMCVAAQKEIRDLAFEMMKLVKEHVPFVDYQVMNCGRICNRCKNG